MNARKFLKLMPLVALCLVCSSAWAAKPTTYTHYTSALVTSEGYYTGVKGSESLVVDASNNITAANISATGTSKFQGSLFTNGNYTASTVLFSSSTAFQQANLPYAIVLKALGGSENDSLLPRGLAGQEVEFLIYSTTAYSTSWKIRPDTAAASPCAAKLLTSVTFNATGQNARLEYISDALGWFIESTGTTAASAAPTVAVPSLN